MTNIIRFKSFETVQIIIVILILSINLTNCISTNETIDLKTEDEVKETIIQLENELKTFENEELLIPSINSLYKSLKQSRRHFRVDPQRKLEELVDKVKTNVGIINGALYKAKEDFKQHNITKHSQLLITPCKDVSDVDRLTEIESPFKNQSYSTDQILYNLYSGFWSLQNCLKQVHLLSLTDNTIPFQNVGDNSGDSECYGIDYSMLWSNYMSHNVYRTRRIILVIDHGNSVEDNLLHLSKLFTKRMISALNENDKFTVIGIATKWSSLTVTEPCGNEHLPSILSGSENNKELAYNFINELTSRSEITDNNTGMRIAIKMARLFYAGDETVMLIFVSPNIQFSMSEAMDIIALNDLSSPLIINTCVVSDGPNSDIQDMSDVLNDFFMENGLKNQLISRGRLVLINNEYTAGMEVAKFYEIFNKKLHRTSMKVSPPVWDTKNQELSLTFSTGFPVGNKFIVMGVDVSFTKFFRDMIYYASYQENMFSVLMDFEGNVLIHPSVPTNKQVKFAHASNYFEDCYKEFLEKPEGICKSLFTTYEYSWKRVENHIILIASVDKRGKSKTFQPKLNWLPSLSSNQFVSYLLSGNSCRYLGHVANFESSSLYLSEKCFKYSFKNGINESMSLKSLPYFQLLVKRDGLQEGIREELIDLVKVTELIEKKHFNSLNSEFIIRRFVATKSGILHVFPGVDFEFGYEPTKRLWFMRANQLKGKIIATPPYLDAGGAGYIITISYATSSSVVGVDVNYGFISKLLLVKNSDCINNNTCFIVDDKGYLISYPDLLRSMASENEPIEQLHLVHKESSVANDLLSHDELVKKLACNDYNTATIQRYYQLNLSYSSILTSSVPYVSYSVGPINGTNLFFGIIKSTSPNTRTFCPCSVIDRICLNCNHMERQECECPCECPIHRSSCSNYTSHDDYKLCYPSLENYSTDPSFDHDDDDNEEIEFCPRVNCDARKTYLTCLGVIGCEWCKKDIYGFSLETPHCSTASECFNGILGGPSPYKDRNVEINSMFTTIKNTGLVLGLIIVFALANVTVVFIWRNYSTPRSNQRIYLSARQEEHLHMSDMNVNDDYIEQGNHSDKLLIDEKKITPISPYCVASNYSRPATAADSDHGYSTMTPHDESEHLSLAPVEIDSLEDDIESDRTTPPIKHKALTKNAHKNCIIVPVTVHRQIDTS